MADDPLSSEWFSPAPSVTHFERHVVHLKKMQGVTVTHADEDEGLLALVVAPDDENLQEQVEGLGRDWFYNVTSGYRDDIGQYCIVLED
jgi:hypothetical protein